MTEENKTNDKADDQPANSPDVEKLKGQVEHWMAKATDFEKRFKGIDPDEVSALRTTVSDLQNQIEQNKAQQKGVDPDQAKEYRTELEGVIRGEFQSELDRAREKADSNASELHRFKAMTEFARTDKINAGDLDLIESKIVSSTKIIDGKLVVVDSEGNQRYKKDNPGQAFTVADLAAEIAEQHPSIAKSSMASGSMGNGSKANGNGVDKYTAWKNSSREDKAKNFTPQERMQFAAQSLKN